MSRKKLIFLAIIPLALLMITVTTSLYAKDEEDIDIRLKWKHNAQFSGIYFAQEKNYYINEGLKINLLERDLSKDSIAEEVASGNVDFGITNPYDLIKAVSEGKKIKAVAVIYQESPSAIISLKEKNIFSPKDFKGKKLGIVSDTKSARTIYELLLKESGLSSNDVEFIVLGENISEDLINNRVDTAAFYRTNETYELKKKGLSYRLLKPEYNGIELYDDVVITSDEMIKNNPEVVRKFVASTIKGWEGAINNKEEALKITSSYSSGIYEDAERESYILKLSSPLIAWSGNSNIGMMDKERWKDIIDIYRTNGFIKNSLKPQDIFTDEFIK